MVIFKATNGHKLNKKLIDFYDLLRIQGQHLLVSNPFRLLSSLRSHSPIENSINLNKNKINWFSKIRNKEWVKKKDQGGKRFLYKNKINLQIYKHKTKEDLTGSHYCLILRTKRIMTEGTKSAVIIIITAKKGSNKKNQLVNWYTDINPNRSKRRNPKKSRWNKLRKLYSKLGLPLSL